MKLVRDITSRFLSSGIAKEIGSPAILGLTLSQAYLRTGTNIFSKEWDALIILDACRTDALKQVAPEFDFLNQIESIWSVGGTSKEWIQNTFVSNYSSEISDTAYITANPHVEIMEHGDENPLSYPTIEDSIITSSSFIQGLRPDTMVSSGEFSFFEPLWDVMIEDSKFPQLHPKVVTDRTINAGRQRHSDRIIAHYMQPHGPFIMDDSEMEDWHMNPLKYLRNGGNFEKVWEGYLDNLRFVLRHLEQLLHNLDADRVIITSDHGELFGEWGLYMHIAGVPHPALRRVPWAVTSASDEESYIPNDYGIERSNRDEILRSLGYL